MEKKIVSILLFSLVSTLSAFAQTKDYQYKAPVMPIEKSGFYEIKLTPAITALLKPGYADLRIINSGNKWVPHLLRAPGSEVIGHTGWIEQTIVHKNSNNHFTEIVIRTAGKKISDFSIEIKNSDVERYCTLTGSDDSTNWFIINDSIRVRPVQSGEQAKTTLAIQFPPTDYRFYKLVIGNEGAAPYNIIAVGTSEILSPDSTLKETYTENPGPVISQKDSGKFSAIKITQQAAFHVEKIAFKISGVKYFFRKVDLYLPGAQSKQQNSPRRLMHSFTISNNSDLQFRMPEILKADSFFLLIHNEDNLPVKLDEVKTFAGYRTVVAYLDKGEQYRLILGNENAVEPNYDLDELSLNFKQSLQEATISAISPTGDAQNKTALSSNNKILMWLLISAAAVILGFFSYKLMSEMNKKETA